MSGQFLSIVFVLLAIITTSLCFDYTIVTPKAFRIDATETVILNLHGYTRGTISSYSFILPSRQEQINHLEPPIILNEQTAANPIEIPVMIRHTHFANLDIRNRQKIEFHVEVTNSNMDFTKTIEVFLSKRSGYFFIVTERPIYKPSETVSIIAFPLNQEMSPERQVLVQFIIKTPDGIGVMRTQPQFLRQDRNPIKTEYDLPIYPQTGNWIVEAIYSEEEYETSESINFRVDTYVLPTFEVTIELEQGFVLENDENFVFYVNARYSYGEPVDGNVYVSVKLKTSAGGLFSREVYKRPSSDDSITAISAGRRRFRVPIEDIEDALGPGVDIQTLIEDKGALIIDAAVNGLAEGIVESTRSPEILFIRSPYRIDTSRLSNFYTPSIIYAMQFDIVDSISGAPKEVSVEITANGVAMLTRSDVRGQVNFQHLFDGSDDQEVMIRTTEAGISAEDQARETLLISPYISPTQSYIQVEFPPLVSVGQVNVFAIFRFNKQATEIRYYILSRGTIVFSGVTPSDVQSRELSQAVAITSDMVPSARIVAYYFNGKEVVSNSRWFDIVDQCSSEVTLSVVDDEVQPGGQVTFELQGPPGGSVTLIGVDRAAYFLYKESRLTREHMFNEMEEYDQGCVRSGGKNSESVFEQAGLTLTTTTVEAPDVFSLKCNQNNRRKKRQALDQKDRLDRILFECERDGKRNLKTGESCEERGDRVLLFTENQKCYDKFLESCKDATEKREEDVSAGRSVDIREADIQAIGDQQQRSDFDESLIFSSRSFNDVGRLLVNVRAKDSITTFDVDAVGMAENSDGFCVAKPKEVRVFKNVFVQIFAPFSLKEREQADLRVTIFNYGAEDIDNIHIQVKHDNIFCSRFNSKDNFVTIAAVSAPSNGANSANLIIFPLRQGRGIIEIRAIEVNEARNLFVQMDRTQKEIVVEPPGVLDNDFGTQPVDLSGNNAVQLIRFDFGFPDSVSPGSRQCWIYAYGNLLGPSIETDPITKSPQNIGNIIRQPTGCGEQILIYTGPNVFVHAYKDEVGDIVVGTPEYTASLVIIGNGFSRMLNYRSNSFPNLLPWANVPYILPSTWLNAYGYKVFTKARLYKMDIDVIPICNSLTWLLGEQEMDGHFDEKKPPLMRQMRGAVGGDVTLAAYIVIALLETDLADCAATNDIPAAVTNAVIYLENNKNDPTFVGRPYGIALLAYALSLARPNSDFGKEINERLRVLRLTTDDGKIFWQGRPADELEGTDIDAYWYNKKPSAIDVEVTAYALLATIQTIRNRNAGVTQDELDDTRKMALWLICQRNEDGAFISTQDTIMGLQALTAYMSWVNSVMPVQPVIDINVILQSAAGTEWDFNPFAFSVGGDAFKTEVSVPEDVMISGGVDITAAGTGAGSISYKCVYRSVIDEESCHFQLSQQVNVTQEDPMKIQLTIKVSKPVGIKAETSIVDIGLLSGFSPVQATMDRINREFAKDGMIDRYEISQQNIIFYLTDISANETTITFDLIQNIKVNRPQPAKITVYDFYEPAVHCGIFYALPNEVQNVQTTGCEEGNAELCKCADGGCPVCRPRDDQENKTLCLKAGTCHSCGEGNDCVNLYTKACQSNYAYIVNVLTVPDPVGNGVFTSFTGNVTDVLFAGDEPEDLVKNQIKTFEIRSDCYAQCEDRRLQTIPNTGNFVRTVDSLLIIASSPERIVRNVTTFKYMIDDQSMMERIIPERRCIRAKNYIQNQKCNNRNVIKTPNVIEQCQRRRRTNTACNVMKTLIKRLNTDSCGK